MRRIIYILLILSSFCLPLSIFAEDRDEIVFDDYSPFFLYGIALVETQIANTTLWGFNRYISQSDYGMITIDSMRTNLTNPWVWDQDEFIVNHLGHPYQGALYYSAGRTLGNGFWASASLTALGSISWELLMETETPSINDFIVTTLGGISVGEMFFRLSDNILHGEDGEILKPNVFRWIGATLRSPTTSLNHALFPGRPSETSNISGFSFLGAGFSQASVSLLPRPDILLEKQGLSLSYYLHLNYGSPFLKPKQSVPYDWFSMKFRGGLDLGDEIFLDFFSEGYLYGRTLYSKKESVRNQLGLYLHYDFIYNRIINLGANSIGPGWIRSSSLGKNWTMENRLFLNFVAMGASDLVYLKYNDIVNNPPEYERRNYSLSSGSNLKAGFHFSRKETLFLDLEYSFYNLYIIDASVPETGSGGIELIGIADLKGKYMFGKYWFVGLGGSLYHKESYYKQFVDLDELMWRAEVFSGIRF